jgi:hypothetical protein
LRRSSPNIKPALETFPFWEENPALAAGFFVMPGALPEARSHFAHFSLHFSHGAKNNVSHLLTLVAV